MADPRRVRTQAERDADGQAWRSVAASRPGYATYRETQPGSPSWWTRHDARPATMLRRVDFATARELDAPPPVDGETCKRWCGFCHLGTEPTPDNSPATGDFGPVPEPPRPDPDIWMTTQPIALPRRRWWHRITRRYL